ncbi:MAG: adenylosuccinate lyase [Opitutales bacterium]
MIADVLAERYASKDMKEIWGGEGKIILERELWIAVMKAQKQLGLDISDADIASYEKVKMQIDLDSINERERITRHDVKARIEEFCDLAGCEHIHKGMTSRDLTENVEQLQVFRAMQLVVVKAVAALVKLSAIAKKYDGLALSARTHNVIAQLTTFSKRMAMFGEDMLKAIQSLEYVIDSYAVRGIKGAVGTQLDQLTLFEGDEEKVLQLDEIIRKHLGIKASINAVGQVYPRSYDFEVVSALYQLTSGPSSFAKTLRIMAGHELASEGFAKGQTGSSAMPHKMNSRSCERLNGFQVILGGYMNMSASLTGDQWNEGDVSCSVVRRVMLPGAFYAIDGLLETFSTILNQMEVNVAVVEAENEKYMPFLLTTTIMMEAVKKGVGRETAHEIIKLHAVATSKDMRAGKIYKNDLLERLANDSELPLDIAELEAISAKGKTKTAMAQKQMQVFVGQVEALANKYPSYTNYDPAPIL